MSNRLVWRKHRESADREKVYGRKKLVKKNGSDKS